jgi:hypothetical protein
MDALLDHGFAELLVRSQSAGLGPFVHNVANVAR